VTLTGAGIALLPKARLALDAARDAREAVDEVRGGLRGTLRIGTMTSVSLVDIPALLGRYHRRYPGVDLHLATAPSGSRMLTDAIAERVYDLAFVSVPEPTPSGVALLELATDTLTLVTAADHPLAGQDRVPIEELDGETFIDFPLGFGIRAVADRAFEGAGVTRRVAVEITNLAEGADYVRHGLGIALVPRFLPIGDDLARIAVTDADLTWRVSLAVPAGRAPSAAARALVAMIEATA
jgi:DNA-binding transcriptional LysR family regulator